MDAETHQWLQTAAKQRTRLAARFRTGACNQHPITCAGPGCNGCCYQYTSAGLFEGVLIAQQLDENGASWDRIQAAFDAEDAIRRDAGTTDTLDCLETLRTVWWESRHGCPLLRSDGGCQLYRLRPITCSTYLVTSPMSRCYKAARTEVLVVDARDIWIWQVRQDLEFVRLVTGQSFLPVLSVAHAALAGRDFLKRGPAALKGIPREY